MIESFDSILYGLCKSGGINEQQFKKFQMNKSNIELPSLYFLPQLQQVNFNFFSNSIN